MSAALPRSLTLAIHPSPRGFGWIAFASPFNPHDWGTVYVRGAQARNQRCLRRIERILDRLNPEMLLLEDFETRRSSRRARIRELGRAIMALASTKGIDVVVISIGEVRGCFAKVGARTRDDIAETAARQFECLRHLLPRRRRAWHSEHPRMALFCAVAVAMTHYQLSAVSLLALL
ncbi:hypothetical protein [Sphingomonas sp.]|uniref:hypothetical protein n=1 Tax=Sphingomonas sp. TaxID=28214 RepID=UPI001B1D0BAB|nr:hypothetical protein [Sphingomonas sp.]MBO9711437.1 hypothetical protein [Sphingomonas sp.]